MSAPSPAPDNSPQVMQMQLQAAADQRAQDKADAAKHVADLAALRDTSRAGAKSSAGSYFQQQGLDPSQYSGDIDTKLNDILAGIAPTDENPGSYFKNAGQSIYGDLTKSNQTRQQAELDKLFSPDFETRKVPLTIDDPYIADIEKTQRGNADAIIQNMIKRGVLTSTGAQGAEADLDRQAPGVRGKLQSFGDAAVAGGQAKLKDVANQARTTAGTLKLGQSFDPSTYSANADQVFNDFVSSLGDQINSKVTGNLFQTNGLAAAGGAFQGAGNTKYNPTAAAGIIDPNNPKTVKPVTSKESIF